MSSVDSKKNADRIRAVKKRSKANQVCMDCCQRAPSSVVMDYGTFVCTQCAGVHREFSHRIKGISMSTFTADETVFIEKNGNDYASKVWRAKWKADDFPKPPSGNVEQIRRFIRETYVDKRWYKEKRSRRKAAPASASESESSEEDEESEEEAPVEVPRSRKKKSAKSRVAESSGGGSRSGSRAGTPVQPPAASRAASATTTADFDLLSRSLPRQPTPVQQAPKATPGGGWAEFDASFDASGFPDEPAAATAAESSQAANGGAAALASLGLQQQRQPEAAADDISSLSALGVASASSMILTPKQLMAAERLEELIRVLRAQLGVESAAMVAVCDEASRRFRADPLRAAKASTQLPKEHAPPAQNGAPAQLSDAPLLTSPRSSHQFEVNPFASADAGGIGSPASLVRPSPFHGQLNGGPAPLAAVGGGGMSGMGGMHAAGGPAGAGVSPFEGLGGRPSPLAAAQHHPHALHPQQHQQHQHQQQQQQPRAPVRPAASASSNPFEMASDDDEDDMDAAGGQFGGGDDPFGSGGAFGAPAQPQQQQQQQQPQQRHPAAAARPKPQESSLFAEFDQFPSK